MPCDSVINITCDLGQVNKDALEGTFKSLGFTGTLENFSGTFEGAYFNASLNRATGKLLISGSYIDAERLTAALRKGHARQIILRQAKRAGWQVKEQGNKIQLLKR